MYSVTPFARKALRLVNSDQNYTISVYAIFCKDYKLRWVSSNLDIGLEIIISSLESNLCLFFL